jgi:DNA-binding NtrC family response regulator
VNREVLIVDDEAEFASILVKVLKRRGFTAHLAPTGERALAMLRERAYSVVLLDVKMPGIGGLEVLARIKQALPGTQVILMTGHLAAGDEERSVAGGAFAFLLKPYPTEQLVAVIEAAERAADEAGRGCTGALPSSDAQETP